MKLKSFLNVKSSIRAKLITISFLLLTIPLVILGIFSYQKSASSLDELGKTNLKNSVELTIELIDTLNKEVEKGTISIEEAQEKTKVSMLGEQKADGTRPINPKLNLGENGYMFVLDQDGTEIAHPTIEGENIWDEEDVNGVTYAQEIVKAGNDSDFTYYEYPLPSDENQLERKVVYAETYPDWGWTVSSGTYMMDFNKQANEILTLNYIVIGITLVVGFLIIWMFAR